MSLGKRESQAKQREDDASVKFQGFRAATRVRKCLASKARKDSCCSNERGLVWVTPVKDNVSNELQKNRWQFTQSLICQAEES